VPRWNLKLEKKWGATGHRDRNIENEHFFKPDLEHIHTMQTLLALLPLCRRPDHTLVVLLAPSVTSRHGFTLEAVNRMIHETSNREGGGGERRR
jgi:hypothetical protein